VKGQEGKLLEKILRKTPSRLGNLSSSLRSREKERKIPGKYMGASGSDAREIVDEEKDDLST
jgi:hypothetical protein